MSGTCTTQADCEFIVVGAGGGTLAARISYIVVRPFGGIDLKRDMKYAIFEIRSLVSGGPSQHPAKH
ncbi:MAG: hypothetical protein ND866_19825 [Pyrinomonadaceae bacterium]|nr:hypothetical protein [Pyrinomonadaceae bacterium]